VSFANGYFHPKAILDIAPVLVYKGGQEAAPVMKLQGAKVLDNYTVVPVSGSSVSHTVRFAYKPGMEVSHLELRLTVADKGKQYPFPYPYKVADGANITYKLVGLHGTPAFAPDAYQAIIREQKEAQIMYLVNSHTVRPNQLSKAEIKEFEQFLANATKDARRDVKNTEIIAYASPEGPQAHNYTLAQNRALAVRNYILDNVPSLRPANFDIINGGENWEGLYKLVEESAMPGRWQVLDIIERTPPDIDYFSNTSRKQMLMNLDGGRVWNYMLANFFPRLRSAATVTIYAPGDNSAARAAAGTIPPARNTEIINRAIDLLGERRSEQALTLLLEVENDPRAWNPLGVCYLLEYNTARAREYFQRAATAGYADGRGNLEQMGRGD